MAKQADPNTIAYDYTYQYDRNANRTKVIADAGNAPRQVVGDPSQGVLHSDELGRSFNAPNELSQTQSYGSQGQALTPVLYTYDAAGNQKGNNGGGTGKPLSIGYYPTNQTQTISDLNQNAETQTWAGAGQAERVGRTWTDQGTNYTATYTWSLLGLSGYSNTGIDEPTKTTSVVSWIVRAPDGTPVAQRYTNGNEYYYLFDGQGDVVGLEDPGVMQGAYDYCPTGNEADLASTTPTAVALGNPLRQGAIPYDDLTKDYFGSNGVIAEDYSGTGIQTPGILFGDDGPCGAFEDAPDCGPLAPAPGDPGEVSPGGAGELPSEPDVMPSPSPFPEFAIDQAIASADEPFNSDVTRGQRALDKKLGRGNAAYVGITSSATNAEAIMQDVLSNPVRVVYGGPKYDVCNALGQGVRLFIGTNRFDTFLNADQATR